MSEKDTTLTVELHDGRTFEVPSGSDAIDQAQGLVKTGSVVEMRDDGNITIHPIHCVKALYVTYRGEHD